MLHFLNPRVASRAAATVVAFALLMTNAVEPAHADPVERTADPVVIDAGNGVAVVIDPETRMYSVTMPTPLVWDSLRYADPFNPDPYSWGIGWGYGQVAVESDGRFAFPRLGVYEYDPASPTHLRGYPKDDVVASAEAGLLPPRGDTMPEREYRASLYHRDTRTTDYFDVDGLLTASITDEAERTDWEYRREAREDGALRLLRIVHPDESVTRIARISDDYYRITAPGGVVNQVQITNATGTDNVRRYFGAREFTEFFYAGVGSIGPLQRILTSDLSTGAEINVEIEGDGTHLVRVERVIRNGQVVFPVG